MPELWYILFFAHSFLGSFLLVEDFFFVSCILLSHDLLASLQYYSNNRTTAYRQYCDTLAYLNMTFTVMFTIESLLKVLAFGPKVCGLSSLKCNTGTLASDST